MIIIIIIIIIIINPLARVCANSQSCKYTVMCVTLLPLKSTRHDSVFWICWKA